MGLWEQAMGVGWTTVTSPDGRLEGFPYEVHASGRVRNTETGHVLEPYARGGPGGEDYLAVELRHQGTSEQVYVHQLVAWAFVSGWDPGKQVEHIDGDPHNNHQANLRWVEAAENLETRG